MAETGDKKKWIAVLKKVQADNFGSKMFVFDSQTGNWEPVKKTEGSDRLDFFQANDGRWFLRNKNDLTNITLEILGSIVPLSDKLLDHQFNQKTGQERISCRELKKIADKCWLFLDVLAESKKNGSFYEPESCRKLTDSHLQSFAENVSAISDIVSTPSNIAESLENTAVIIRRGVGSHNLAKSLDEPTTLAKLAETLDEQVALIEDAIKYYKDIAASKKADYKLWVHELRDGNKVWLRRGITCVNNLASAAANTGRFALRFAGWISWASGIHSAASAFIPNLRYVYQITEEMFRGYYPVKSSTVYTTWKRFAVYAQIVENLMIRKVIKYKVVKEVPEITYIDYHGYICYFREELGITLTGEEIREIPQITFQDIAEKVKRDLNKEVIDGEITRRQARDRGMWSYWSDRKQSGDEIVHTAASHGLMLHTVLSKLNDWIDVIANDRTVNGLSKLYSGYISGQEDFNSIENDFEKLIADYVKFKNSDPATYKEIRIAAGRVMRKVAEPFAKAVFKKAAEGVAKQLDDLNEMFVKSAAFRYWALKEIGFNHHPTTVAVRFKQSLEIRERTRAELAARNARQEAQRTEREAQREMQNQTNVNGQAAALQHNHTIEEQRNKRAEEERIKRAKREEHWRECERRHAQRRALMNHLAEISKNKRI